jgi:GTP cyclohydrolase II
VPVIVEANEENAFYLQTKQELLGHLLDPHNAESPE